MKNSKVDQITKMRKQLRQIKFILERIDVDLMTSAESNIWGIVNGDTRMRCGTSQNEKNSLAILETT